VTRLNLPTLRIIYFARSNKQNLFSPDLKHSCLLMLSRLETAANLRKKLGATILLFWSQFKEIMRKTDSSATDFYAETIS
jgi:hypothetical protein